MTGGFLEQRRMRPASLGVVVAVHAAVIAALALSVTHQLPTEHFFNPIVDWEPVPPPPPPPPEHLARTQPTARSTPTTPRPTAIDHPDTEVPTQTPTGPAFNLPPLTDVGGSGALGPGGGTVVAPPPAAPVLADAEIDPRFAREFQPDYPAALERAGVEGTAVVRVRIGADGRVREVQQVSADDPAFFTSTERQALRHWRFHPATRDGAAVETWKTITVHFRLQDG